MKIMELEEAKIKTKNFIKAFKTDDIKNVIGFDIQAIETVLQELENSISKKVIENELDELNNMKIEGELFTTAVNFAKKVIEEILEEN